MKLFLEIYFGVPLILYTMHCVKRKKIKAVNLIDTLKTVFLWPIIILMLIWENI